MYVLCTYILNSTWPFFFVQKCFLFFASGWCQSIKGSSGKFEPGSLSCVFLLHSCGFCIPCTRASKVWPVQGLIFEAVLLLHPFLCTLSSLCTTFEVQNWRQYNPPRCLYRGGQKVKIQWPLLYPSTISFFFLKIFTSGLSFAAHSSLSRSDAVRAGGGGGIGNFGQKWVNRASWTTLSVVGC